MYTLCLVPKILQCFVVTGSEEQTVADRGVRNGLEPGRLRWHQTPFCHPFQKFMIKNNILCPYFYSFPHNLLII